MSAQLGYNQPGSEFFELFHPAKIRKIPETATIVSDHRQITSLFRKLFLDTHV